MCTVTFVALKDRVLITSSRDEKVMRQPADLPEAHQLSSGKILFPKDRQAGGTWVAMHNNGNVMVLLNGAFKAHTPQPPYRKSRGLVFLDILNSDSPVDMFDEIDLSNIEPFTLIIWQQGNLWENRWDGRDKYSIPLITEQAKIWSSVTLYDEEVIAKRRKWFSKWLKTQQFKSAEQVMAFHEFGGDGDERNDLRMNRDGITKTLSITCMEILPGRSVMHYKDLHAGLLSVNEWYLSNDFVRT
jgi:hypothetical protein